jgi:hypothetical protein
MYGRKALDTGRSIDVEIRFEKVLTILANNRDEMCAQFRKANSGLISLQFGPLRQLLCPLILISS